MVGIAGRKQDDSESVARQKEDKRKMVRSSKGDERNKRGALSYYDEKQMQFNIAI